MADIETLWAAKQAAEKAEQAACADHEAAELLGSGPAYDAAFEALTQARIRLQTAEAEYDTSLAAN
jgi:hypothetical protein